MNYVVVIPSIYQPYTDACLESLKIHPDYILVVDNTENNIGVPASWNKGIDFMRQTHSEWVIVMSAAMRFGEPGGLDFIEGLKDNRTAWAVEADNDVGWHLIAFHKNTIHKVGKFDTIFGSGYFEDLDYSWRIRIAAGAHLLKDPLWPKIPCDCSVASVAHGVIKGGAQTTPVLNEKIFRRKWGGTTTNERFTSPYNDPKRTIKDIG